MYCRTHELRLKLCDEYEIKPIGRFKLLNGRTVVSDAGDMDITDEYIIFDCILRKGGQRETIYCGKYVAEDLCKIINCPMPPLFNPLRNTSKSNKSEHQNKKGTGNLKWNPIRKQLYDILLVIISYLGNVEKESVLFHIKERLENPDYIEYYPKGEVKSVNTYLKKMDMTFQNIIDELSKTNNIRYFQYDLVLEYLLKQTNDQHFC